VVILGGWWWTSRGWRMAEGSREGDCVSARGRTPTPTTTASCSCRATSSMVAVAGQNVVLRVVAQIAEAAKATRARCRGSRSRRSRCRRARRRRRNWLGKHWTRIRLVKARERKWRRDKVGCCWFLRSLTRPNNQKKQRGTSL
jgi:hypothetical protein